MILQCLGKCTRYTRPAIKYTNEYGQLPSRSFTIRLNNFSRKVHSNYNTKGQLLGTPLSRQNVWLLRLKNTAPELRKAKLQKVEKYDVMRLISLAKSEKFVLAGKVLFK